VDSNFAKSSQKSTSFSISTILSSNGSSRCVTSQKRKYEDRSRIAVGRHGVAKFTRLESMHDHVTVTLENRGLWEIFHNVGTEMVITKSGRRMFPALKVSVVGLDPSLKYIIMMDVVPADNYRYKYHESEWLVTGKAYPDVPKSKRVHCHSESPSSGAKWMSSVTSFHKVKITNNATASKPGQIVLNSLHKYQPRIHIVRAANVADVTEEDSMIFVFPETSFMAVTAYQSEQITQLKIDNNPFAKGFRDPSPSDIERARLMSSIHYRIPEYPYVNNLSYSGIEPQGHYFRSQYVLPVKTPTEGWFIHPNMVPGSPPQTPIQVMPTSSSSPKRMKQMCSPECQCMNSNFIPSYATENESTSKSSEDLVRLHPSSSSNVICAYSNHYSSVPPSHLGHFSTAGSTSQLSVPIQNTINHGPMMHSCCCCIDKRQLQWTNDSGRKYIKRPLF